MSDFPSLGELTLGGIAVVCIAVVAVILAKRENVKSSPASLTIEQAMEVIKANTEINTRLVTAIEQQTRIINDLAYAVHELVGHVKGGK